jgi:hypothetical protein
MRWGRFNIRQTMAAMMIVVGCCGLPVLAGKDARFDLAAQVAGETGPAAEPWAAGDAGEEVKPPVEPVAAPLPVGMWSGIGMMGAGAAVGVIRRMRGVRVRRAGTFWKRGR